MQTIGIAASWGENALRRYLLKDYYIIPDGLEEHGKSTRATICLLTEIVLRGFREEDDSVGVKGHRTFCKEAREAKYEKHARKIYIGHIVYICI